MSYDYGSIQPGYKNPLEGSGSIKGDYDWGSFSKGVDWDQTPGIAKSGSAGADFLKSWLDKDREKYRDEAKSGGDRPYFGDGFKGTGGKVLENLGVVYPQQHGPMYLPGQQGESGTFSKIAGVAAPFASLIPGVGPIVSAGLSAASQTGW